MKIYHLPYGLDDPYIRLPGVERNPRDPLADESVKINFSTPPLVGQRAWIEYKINENFYKCRAQFQNNVDNHALWEGYIPPAKLGEKVEYRIRFGRSTKNSIVTQWYSYTVKQWKEGSVEKILNIKGTGEESKIYKIQTLTDGINTYNTKIFFKRDENEKFYGLGEHYDEIEIQNGVRHVHVFDQYKVQKERGYAPVPFIFSDKGFGIFLNTGFQSKWNFSEKYIEIEVDTLGYPLTEKIETYIWNRSTPMDIIPEIYKISQPQLPPIWVFGPWMSANEWNSQKKIQKVLKKVKEYNVPTTVLVIEAWSDEETFYIFNGAEYQEKSGGENFCLDDFHFKDPWPDPKKLIKELNEMGIKLILWQIPVIKYYKEFKKQHKNDLIYASKMDFLIKKTDGSLYEIPEGRWFERSYVVNFFNKKAALWWAEKRRYLIEELGVSGFKTDGGEHLWGRDITVTEVPQTNPQSRNLYPEKYFQSLKSLLDKDKILFSRSGYIHSPKSTLFWVGDEDSEYEALESNIIAGLNVSISGNPFWGWDIAGFSGDLPEADLYKRSCELAIFTPIFQFHSEDSGDPVPSAERSPWNISEYYKDHKILDFYRFCASLRMNLSPYILQEAKFCVQNSLPLTIPISLINPNLNGQRLAYYFGRDILVYPSIFKKEQKQLKLPEGEWLNLWSGEWHRNEISDYGSEGDHFHSIFLKKHSVIPLSVNNSGMLGIPHWNQEINSLLIIDDLKCFKDENSFIKKYEKEISKIKIDFNVQKLQIGYPEEKTNETEDRILSIKWLYL